MGDLPRFTHTTIDLAKCWDADGNEVPVPLEMEAKYDSALKQAMFECREMANCMTWIDEMADPPWSPAPRPTMTALGTIFGACLT